MSLSYHSLSARVTGLCRDELQSRVGLFFATCDMLLHLVLVASLDMRLPHFIPVRHQLWYCEYCLELPSSQ